MSRQARRPTLPIPHRSLSLVLLGGLLAAMAPTPSASQSSGVGPADQDQASEADSVGAAKLSGLTAGDIVRIRTSTNAFVMGRVRSVAPDSLHLTVIAPNGSEAFLAVGLSELEAAELRGERRRVEDGLKVGLALAAAAGIVSAVTWEPCDETGFLSCLFVPESRGEAFTMGALIGGAIAIPAGLLIGAFARTETWSPLDLGAGATTAGLTLVRTSEGGVGVGFTVPLGGG